jgi:hypothetical protein
MSATTEQRVPPAREPWSRLRDAVEWTAAHALRLWQRTNKVSLAFGGLFVAWLATVVLPVALPLKLLSMLALLTVVAIYFLSRDRAQVRDMSWFVNLLMLAAIIIVALSVSTLLSPADQRYLAKLAAIVTLSFLPGWLYLQFTITKGKTLWDEYVLSLHRLDAASKDYLPPAPAHSRYSTNSRGTRDEHNLFVQKFASAYGDVVEGPDGTVRTRFRTDTFRPVLFATILLVVGWTLVLQPEPYQNLTVFEGLMPSQHPALPSDVLRFAFIGAYLFIVQSLMRRYFQDDLKANAYISGIVRIISVTLIVVVLHSAWPSGATSYEYAFAFFVGIFPQLGLQAVRALVGRGFRHLIPNFDTRYPLSALDGMDLWYEARLLEEGIEDLQNLATCNFVDLMLYTRVPLERLVDWVDQAHLILRVGEGDRDVLRRFGIRTATDLLDALEPQLAGDLTTAERDRQLALHRRRVRSLANVLNTDQPADWPPILETVVTTLQTEPNLHHVRHWKEYSQERHPARRAVQA